MPPSLKISESSSNGSYRNTDELWWRYGISRSCDECSIKHCAQEMWRIDVYQIPYYSRGIEGEKRTHPGYVDCLIEVIRSSCEEMWRVDAYQIPYYSRGIDIDEFVLKKYWSLMKVRNQPTLRRMKIYYYWTNIRKWNYFNASFIEDFRK
jgi:hypothetical protein